MFPTTTERVPANTAAEVNQRIAQETERSVDWHAQHPNTISKRLAELDREWDIERTLEANAATAMLVGLTLGATVSRKFFIFPAVVAGFLLQHAVQGWCPPLPFLRRRGVRTESEIDEERFALKTVRGDFDDRSTSAGPDASAPALAAVRA